MKTCRALLIVLVLALFLPGSALAADKEKRHPTYTLTGRDAPPADSPLNPNFVPAEEAAALSEQGFWRGSYLPERLVGLAVADIDRDGRNEVAYATLKNIHVARFTGNTLSPLAAFQVKPDERNVSLDLLDVDGDGRPEIIVSAQNDGNRQAASRILSFDGQSLTELASGLTWYLRVASSPSGRFLAGQKPATSTGNYYSGSVQRLAYSEGRVSSTGSVGLPEFVDLFNFAFAELGSGRTPMTIAVRFPSEHLFLYESGGKAWESQDEYGGTLGYLLPYDTAKNTEAGNKSDKRLYLPARILVADIDRDGRNEFIVAKNRRGGVPFMSNQRDVSGGVMEAFKYGNLSLIPIFRSRVPLPGAAVDYQLADFNNNGTMDLVVAVMIEPGSGMMKEGRSVIVAYEM